VRDGDDRDCVALKFEHDDIAKSREQRSPVEFSRSKDLGFGLGDDAEFQGVIPPLYFRRKSSNTSSAGLAVVAPER